MRARCPRATSLDTDAEVQRPEEHIARVDETVAELVGSSSRNGS